MTSPSVTESTPGFPATTLFVRRSTRPNTVLIFPLPAARTHNPVSAFLAGVHYVHAQGSPVDGARVADDWGDAAFSFEAGRRCAAVDPAAALWHVPSAEHVPVFPTTLEDWHRRHPRTDLKQLRAAVIENQPVFARHDGEWVSSDWTPLSPQEHRHALAPLPRRPPNPRANAGQWLQTR